MGVELGDPPKVTYTEKMRHGADNITSVSTRKYGKWFKIRTFQQTTYKYRLEAKEVKSNDRKCNWVKPNERVVKCK